MRQTRFTATIAMLVAANLVTLGFAQSAHAGVVGTQAAIEAGERTARLERIDAVLARDHVQQQLVRFGVDPADARQRIANLNDRELAALEQRMDELPAGAGAVEVLGIVLLVLLVLELVGVTDVFKAL